MKLVMASSIYGVGKVFQPLFDKVEYLPSGISNDKLTGLLEKFDKNDVLGLEGGEDISTSLYGQDSIISYRESHESFRDRRERILFDYFSKLGGCIAICRGAQLACALEGGALFQHVYNHAGSDHLMMDTRSGEQFLVSSAHHQMLDLRKLNPERDFELLGIALPNRSEQYHTDGEILEEIPYEPEAVWFKKSKCLAIQFHPEFMDKNDRAVEWSKDRVKEFFNNENQ